MKPYIFLRIPSFKKGIYYLFTVGNSKRSQSVYWMELVKEWYEGGSCEYATTIFSFWRYKKFRNGNFRDYLWIK